MKDGELETIRIELNTIKDLFIEPDYNPFDPKSHFHSSLDELVDQARELSLKLPLKISITLSTPPEDANIEGLTSNAINRFCTVKIRECEQAIHELRSQGKRDLLSALLLSFILIFGEFFAVQLRFLPKFLTYLLATGLGLIAWVVLWPPLNKLLYEWRPCRRSQRIYKYLQAAKLEINTNRTGQSKNLSC